LTDRYASEIGDRRDDLAALRNRAASCLAREPHDEFAILLGCLRRVPGGMLAYGCCRAVD
jgi:hypothetical protein